MAQKRYMMILVLVLMTIDHDDVSLRHKQSNILAGNKSACTLAL